MSTQHGGVYIWPDTGGGASVASQTFTSYVQIGAANYASVGDVRVANNTTIVAARNFANSANISALATDTTNNIIIGDASQTASVISRATVSHALQVTGSNRFSVSDVDLISYSLPVLLHATNTSTTGEIRTRNNTTIVSARNAANSANIAVLATTSGDAILLGGVDMSPAYAEIYKEASATAFACDGVTKNITTFTGASPPALNCTTDTANGTITVDKAGVFIVTFSCAGVVNAGTPTIDFWLYTGSISPGTTRRVVGSAGLRFNVSITMVMSAGAAVVVRPQLLGTNTGTTVTIDYANFSVVRQLAS